MTNNNDNLTAEQAAKLEALLAVQAARKAAMFGPRCADHPAYEATNCPVCGTAAVIL